MFKSSHPSTSEGDIIWNLGLCKSLNERSQDKIILDSGWALNPMRHKRKETDV